MSSSYSSPVKCDSVKTSFDNISATKVYEELLALDTTKAKGLDGIGPLLLKHCTLTLYQPLCHLFVQSVKQHRIPVARVEAPRDYANPQGQVTSRWSQGTG